ncbi:unnamed protein product [Cyprideis torosa]|uniref:Uncharacterized protein n=1 Tax=Cyprideis torosa TaxID=163714 RepID=A0A7R8W782_9CRUS|nr:unnamed protein product [Cyprideis torosa]CAG0887310.1 unnamed protein product [Cyprideis torosa]
MERRSVSTERKRLTSQERAKRRRSSTWVVQGLEWALKQDGRTLKESIRLNSALYFTIFTEDKRILYRSFGSYRLTPEQFIINVIFEVTCFQMAGKPSKKLLSKLDVADIEIPLHDDIKVQKLKLERPRQGGLNGRLLFAVLASAVGSAFQHGYNLGVVNAPQAEIENFINQTAFIRSGEVKGLEMAEIKFIFSWATSIYCVGGMLGGSLVGYFADTFGRKGALLMNNVLVFIAALLFGFSKMAQSYEMIIVGRFFIGINSGFNAGLAPMYLTEVAPVHLRGAVGTVYQLVITISIMVSQIIGMKSVLGTADGWPILFALTACAGVLQLLTLPFCPDSPKYLLINKGQDEEAENALKWFRGTADIADEMQEVRKECDEEKLRNTASMREMIMNPVLRFPLLISLMMMVAQQFSGINCAIYYSTEIFKQAGFREQGAQYATLGMGAMNVAMTFVSLVLVERAGRKSLMIFGLVGMFVCTILLTICLAAKDDVSWLSYVAVVLVISFVVMFATGPGSIPWFIVNELFTQGARPLATSIAVATNWGANFFVGLAFLPISLALGPYVFLIFSGLLLFFAMFTYKYVPETKNRTIEEIQSMFRQRSYQ